MPFRIPYKRVGDENRLVLDRVLPALQQVVGDGQFILRQAVTDFEQQAAIFLGAKHCIGVNSGTDALFFLLASLDLLPGDEVILPSHTFVATAAAVMHAGGRPVFVDIGDDFNIDADAMEQAITKRTRAILCVHMNGRMCQMDRLQAIARQHNLALVEDAAQSFGAKFRGEPIGAFGVGAAVSFHPLKLLSGWGDGGLVVTAQNGLAERIKQLRCHGERSKTEYVLFGYNSRLDNIQALVLSEKLKVFSALVEHTRQLAARYRDRLQSIADIQLPAVDDADRFSIFANYVIRTPRRDALHQQLRDQGIESMVHWPVPLHRQKQLFNKPVSLPKTDRVAQESLALPIGPMMSGEDVDEVVAAIKHCA